MDPLDSPTYTEASERSDSEWLADAMKSELTEQEGSVLRSLYIEEKNLREVAAEIGISFSNVRNIRDRAITKLKEAYEHVRD